MSLGELKKFAAMMNGSTRTKQNSFYWYDARCDEVDKWLHKTQTSRSYRCLVGERGVTLLVGTFAFPKCTIYDREVLDAKLDVSGNSNETRSPPSCGEELSESTPL